jgi:hypothetical protein
MNGSRTRLINAVRHSMLQRAQLQRKVGVARDAFKPAALVSRGKYRVGEVVDDAAHVVRQEFRDNRLPITIAAVAGVAWMFREPIKEHAPRIGRKIQEMATAVVDRLRPAEDAETEEDIEPLEEDDEAVQ